MPQTKIQQIFAHGWDDYCKKYQPSSEQSKAAYCIMNCKSGAFGYNISLCEECNYLDFHANSCRNRNCPNCQAVLKELWINERSSELIDAWGQELNYHPHIHCIVSGGGLSKAKALKLCTNQFLVRM